MEKRKSALSMLKACRFCLTQEGSLSSLYDRSRTPKNAVTLPLQILSCVSVEVFPSDRMPAQICERCRFFMDVCYRFKQICRQADETIMQYVQVEGPLDPVTWHPKLTKLYRSSTEPAKRDKGKPQTPQAMAVASAASNDEEESDEDEDVYNIKIGDGPEESKETCIKVVKTGDKLHITKDNPKSKTKKDAETDGCEQTDDFILHSEAVVFDLLEKDDDSDKSDRLSIHKSPSANNDLVEVSNKKSDRPEIVIITILDDDLVSKVDDTSDVEKRPFTQDSRFYKSHFGSHEDVSIDQTTEQSFKHNQTAINTDIRIQEHNISSSNNEEDVITVIPTESPNELANPISDLQTMNAISFWVGDIPRDHSNDTIHTSSSENSSSTKQYLTLELQVIPSRHNDRQLNEGTRNEQSSSTDTEKTVAAIANDNTSNDLLNSHSAIETVCTHLPLMENEKVPSNEDVLIIEGDTTVEDIARDHSNITIHTSSSENSSSIKQDLTLELQVIPSHHNEHQLNEATRNEQSSSTDTENAVAAIANDNISNNLLNSHSVIEIVCTHLPRMEKENVPSIEDVLTIEGDATVEDTARDHSNVTIHTYSSKNSSSTKQDLTLELQVIPSRHNECQLNEATRNEQSSSTDTENAVAATANNNISNDLLNSHSAIETVCTRLPHMENENVPSIEDVQIIGGDTTDSDRFSKSIESSLSKYTIEFAGPGQSKVANYISENDETSTNAEIHLKHGTLPDIDIENKNYSAQSNTNLMNDVSLHNDEDSQIQSFLPKDGYVKSGDPDRASTDVDTDTCMDDQDFSYNVVIVQDGIDETIHDGSPSRLSISPDRIDENSNSRPVSPDVGTADTNSTVIHIISSNESTPTREENIEDVEFRSSDDHSDQKAPVLNLNLPFWYMNGTIGRTELTITDDDIEEEIPTAETISIKDSPSPTDQTLTNKLPPPTSNSTFTSAKEILATRSEISIVPIEHAKYRKVSNVNQLSVDVSAQTAAIDYISDDDVVEVSTDLTGDRCPPADQQRLTNVLITTPRHSTEENFPSPVSEVLSSAPRSCMRPISPSIFVDAFDGIDQPEEALYHNVIEVETDKTRSTYPQTKILETIRQSNKIVHFINEDRVDNSHQSRVQSHAQTDSDKDLSEDDVVEVPLDHGVIDVYVDPTVIPKHRPIVHGQYRRQAPAYISEDEVTTPPRKRNYSAQQLHLNTSQDIAVEVQLDPLPFCFQEKTKSQDLTTYGYTLTSQSEESKDLARTVLCRPQNSDEATITHTAQSKDQPVHLTPSKDFPYVYVGSQTFTTSVYQDEDGNKEAGDRIYDAIPTNNPIKSTNIGDSQSTSKGENASILPIDKLNSHATQGDREPSINDFPYIYVEMSVLDHLPDLVPKHTDLQDKSKLRHKKTKISCPECPLELSSQKDLNYHMLSTHKRNEAIQCFVCEEWLNRRSLAGHLRRFHLDILKYKCPKCALRFTSVSEMIMHNNRHRPLPYVNRRYVCSICHKRYHTELNLDYHKQNIHQGSLYTCELCPQSFNTAMRLARHLQVEHGVSRPYPCKYCEKSFLKSHHYTRHMRIKHAEHVSTGSPFNDNLYHCEQCEDRFSSQDALIYHSAQHATENLTCPLCHETFDHVEEVSAHIKTHVDGEQFMCELCELVFTSKEKLDQHLADKHDEEMMQDQSQDEEDSMDVDEEDDDINFNIKEDEDDLIVEVKKPDEFMLTEVAPTKPIAANIKSGEMKTKNMPALESPGAAKAATPVKEKLVFTKSPQKNSGLVGKRVELEARAVQRVEIVKHVANKEAEKVVAKCAPASSAGASDKSLRLLEKELQELKRTNSENDAKIPTKSADVLRSSRRPQVHSSTPKPRAAEEKKTSTPPVKMVDKKQPEKRVVVTKENKEPRERQAKQNNNSVREDREAPPKTVVKNGAADKNSGAAQSSDENPRRSSRGAKVKDYAKMVNRRQSTRDSSDDSDDDDEEYTESVPESRSRARRPSAAAAAAAEPPAPRKRGRPRRDATPAKVKKPNVKEDEDETEDEQLEHAASKPPAKRAESAPPAAPAPAPPAAAAAADTEEPATPSTPKPPVEESPKSTIVSPTGQTLKKVQLKSLPPGIKPLPLHRTMNQGELCEMQIGTKVVKVQKIVMTKAEVEAMTKKGLVEMKDGTMVLKQGIKLPTSDMASLKSTLVGGTDACKESPVMKAAPTRCDLGYD